VLKKMTNICDTIAAPFNNFNLIVESFHKPTVESIHKII